MTRLSDVAQLLVSSWLLASPEKQPIPTSHGLFDRALEDVYNSGQLPDWAKRELHFSDSRTGLRCIEMPAIIEWWQNAELTSVPNSSYSVTNIKVSPRVGKVMLHELGVPLADAEQLGKTLLARVDAHAAEEKQMSA